MHMHSHLYFYSCICDYGPLHTFWLYAFEPYYVILGLMPNNNCSIEIQLMSRFLRDSQNLSYLLPKDFTEDLNTYFPKHELCGSVSETISATNATEYNDFDIRS